jgi:hypothetical protein
MSLAAGRVARIVELTEEDEDGLVPHYSIHIPHVRCTAPCPPTQHVDALTQDTMHNMTSKQATMLMTLVLVLPLGQYRNRASQPDIIVSVASACQRGGACLVCMTIKSRVEISNPGSLVVVP